MLPLPEFTMRCGCEGRKLSYRLGGALEDVRLTHQDDAADAGVVQSCR